MFLIITILTALEAIVCMYINPLIQGALWLELQACNSSMILGNIHYGSSMCHRGRPLVKTPAVLGIFHLERPGGKDPSED